jgi:hypothetical protein
VSLLVHLAPCGHMQVLTEIGETPPSGGMTWVTYPLDVGNTVERGDHMTCITCDDIREVESAQ